MDAELPWRLVFPEENPGTNSCDPSSPSYRDVPRMLGVGPGIRVDLKGQPVLLYPRFTFAGVRPARWWHYPAQVLLPVAIAVDLVTIPIQFFPVLESDVPC